MRNSFAQGLKTYKHLFTCLLCVFFFFLATPNQGLNLCPRQWKQLVLSTGQPGNFPIVCLKTKQTNKKNTSWINSPGPLDCNSSTVKELTLDGKVVYARNNSSLPMSQAGKHFYLERCCPTWKPQDTASSQTSGYFQSRCAVLHTKFQRLSPKLRVKIPWTEKPGRLQSMGPQRVGHDWAASLSLLKKKKIT